VIVLSQRMPGRLWELASKWLDDADEELPSEANQETRDDFSVMVQAAKQEWLNAKSYFNNATEPELVDHAILSLQAAERKYMYWLQRMKESQ